jgi:hypothetical protein
MKWLRDTRQCELLLADDRLRASTRLLDGFRAIRTDQRDNMHSSLANPCKFSLPIRLALVGVLTLLSSGWTCGVFFVSCQGVGTQPQINSLSPDTIPNDAETVVLTVEGSGFTPQSQILWNGNALQTTSVDLHHLQTTITQQTFDSFGGSAGSSVQISASSQGPPADTGCPINGNSAARGLAIH